jgi:hypothetical protein
MLRQETLNRDIKAFRVKEELRDYSLLKLGIYRIHLRFNVLHKRAGHTSELAT